MFNCLNKTKIVPMAINRGDTKQFEIEVVNHETNEFLELDKAFMTIKAQEGDSSYVAQISLGNGVTKVDDGVYLFKLPSSATKNVEVGEYYYDVRIVIEDTVVTPIKGIMYIEQNYTSL